MGLNGPCKMSESDVSEFSCLVCEIIFLLCRHKNISMIQNGSSEICVENRCNTFRQFRRLNDYVTQVEMSFHVEISVTHKCMEWLHHTTLAAYSHQTEVGAKAKKIKRQAKKRDQRIYQKHKKTIRFRAVWIGLKMWKVAIAFAYVHDWRFYLKIIDVTIISCS